MSKYTGFRVSYLWAYLAVGDGDEEGICGIISHGISTPLIASDKVRLDELRPHAEMIAKATGKTVQLVKFTVRENIEEIKP